MSARESLFTRLLLWTLFALFYVGAAVVTGIRGDGIGFVTSVLMICVCLFVIYTGLWARFPRV